MRRISFSFFTFCILFLFLTTIVLAEEPAPSPPVGNGLLRTADGLWISTGEDEAAAQASKPQASGGPDDYGYVWTNTTPLGWIDAGGGIDSGISSTNDHTGPIDIGFPFKYYENTYTNLYISRHGFVTFRDTTSWWNDQSRVPSLEKPDDVIAPHWIPIHRVDGHIRYLRGGDAPNRWFVVEWNRVVSDCCTGDSDVDRFTFQVVLYENGDTRFQYLDMTVNGSYYCMASGIEDSTGLDGLEITPFCGRVTSNHAVHITRPPVSARVNVYPRYQGRFTQGAAVERFEIPVRNTGELGVDTYDVTINSPWPATLISGDGVTLLADTDGDSVPDTWQVSQGGNSRLFVDVQTPLAVNVGDNNETVVTLRSSMDTSKSKSAHLRTAIPAPFAQVYYDYADGAMQLYRVAPSAQVAQKATADSYFGSNPAVTETPGGYLYVWIKGRQNQNKIWTNEIEYTLLNRAGRASQTIYRLTNHDSATVNVYDYSPVISTAPDGRMGILWYRYIYNSQNSQWNYNIFFAILDGAGNLLHGPEDMTKNGQWGGSDAIGIPRFWGPRITATKDSRFVLAWEKYLWSGQRSYADIFIAVRDTAGNVVKEVTQFTNAIATGYYYNDPALTSLVNGRVFFANSRSGLIEYRTLDSSGNLAKTIQTRLPAAELRGYALDAIQLSGGYVVLAWTDSSTAFDTTTIAFLDADSSAIIAGPVQLPVARPRTDSYNLSVTADQNNNAIVTWADVSSYRDLYYALVNGDGNVQTPATIFRTSQVVNGEPRIYSSYEGYGNTSNTILPTTSGVDGFATAPELVGAAQKGQVTIPIGYGNNGGKGMDGATLSIALDSGLSYIGANPPPQKMSAASSDAPAKLTWSLPNLELLGYGRVLLTVATPSTTIGTRHSVQVELLAPNDQNGADNSWMIQVMEALQLFLAQIRR